MLKKDKAIVFLLTRDYKFALATIVANLQEKNRHNYDDIVVYHDGLSKQECEDLHKLEPNLVFIQYSFEEWKKEHQCDQLSTPQLRNFINRFSHFALSKYKLFEQLEFYKKVLFLDLDMVIQDDFSDLFALEGIAWRTEAPFLRKFGTQANKPILPEFSTMPQSHPAPNGGLIYATDSIDWKACLEQARFFLMTYLDCFGSVVDELTFSWVAYKLQLPLTELDHTVYNVLPRVAQNGSKIIHFMGAGKTWASEMMQFAFPTWMQNYQRCLKIADFSSEKVIDFGPHGQILRRQLNEAQWLNFLQTVNLTIPQNLRLRYQFEQEVLVLDYKQDIFYEFGLHKNTDDYRISLVIRNKLIIDKATREYISTLVAQNDNLSFNENVLGISISTKKQHINQISTLWDYFYKLTSNILARY